MDDEGVCDCNWMSACSCCCCCCSCASRAALASAGCQARPAREERWRGGDEAKKEGGGTDRPSPGGSGSEDGAAPRPEGGERGGGRGMRHGHWHGHGHSHNSRRGEIHQRAEERSREAHSTDRRV